MTILLVQKAQCILTQTHTYETVIHMVMTIGVECHAAVARGCTEERRGSIATPIVTHFVTITRETRHEEATEKRVITDQQLIGITVACIHTIPQSIGTSIIPIVPSGRYGLADFSLEVGLVSSLVIDEDDLCKLE